MRYDQAQKLYRQALDFVLKYHPKYYKKIGIILEGLGKNNQI